MRYGKPLTFAFFALTVLLAEASPALVQADDDTIRADIALLQKEGVGTDGPALLTFLRKRTPSDKDRQNMHELIRQLGSDHYKDRAQATNKLLAIGRPAVQMLRAAVSDSDREISDRARKCLEKIASGPGPELPAAAARLLVVHKPAGAVEVLVKFVPYADDEWLEEVVQTCVGELAIKGGKVDPALTDALKDPLPARRAVAGYVLGKMGDLGQRLAVRELLADPDAAVRYRAALGLVGKELYLSAQENEAADKKLLEDQKINPDDAGLLSFFRSRTLSEQDQQYLHKMVRQWGDGNYKLRNRAWHHVLSKGTSALPFLELATSNPDIEIRDRAQKAISLIKSGPGPALPTAAARLLTRKAPPEALETLVAYIPFADDDSVEEEVLNALCVLSTREVKIHPSLLTALRDELPARRGAAAFVIGRMGTGDDMGQARHLLFDPDARVKLRAAQGLLAARSKDPLPILVELLTKAPMALALRAQDTLGRIAGESAPTVMLGKDLLVERQAVAREWGKWLDKNGPALDLSRINTGEGYLGLRVIAEFDWNGRANGGKVWVCGRDGKERFKIENLLGPMDAQLLPNGNVLVAENNGRMVREFNRQGHKVWEKIINGNPVSCQRLANGNTFIACYYSVMELDKGGNEVFNHNRGFNSYIFSARKLRNGNIVAMTSMGTIVEIESKTGRDLHSIPVQSLGNWCSVEELRNGRYLVALMAQNKVVEIDRNGKETRAFNVVGAHTATRLPNGHTLVAGMNNRFVAEFNSGGKEVWRQTTTGRPWRINFR
jgi:HEAT repeat protein